MEKGDEKDKLEIARSIYTLVTMLEGEVQVAREMGLDVVISLDTNWNGGARHEKGVAAQIRISETKDWVVDVEEYIEKRDKADARRPVKPSRENWGALEMEALIPGGIYVPGFRDDRKHRTGGKRK